MPEQLTTKEAKEILKVGAKSAEGMDFNKFLNENPLGQEIVEMTKEIGKPLAQAVRIRIQNYIQKKTGMENQNNPQIQNKPMGGKIDLNETKSKSKKVVKPKGQDTKIDQINPEDLSPKEIQQVLEKLPEYLTVNDLKQRSMALLGMVQAMFGEQATIKQIKGWCYENEKELKEILQRFKEQVKGGLDIETN